MCQAGGGGGVWEEEGARKRGKVFNITIFKSSKKVAFYLFIYDISLIYSNKNLLVLESTVNLESNLLKLMNG